MERKQLCPYNENLSDNLCENVKSLRQVQTSKSDSSVHCKRPDWDRVRVKKRRSEGLRAFAMAKGQKRKCAMHHTTIKHFVQFLFSLANPKSPHHD